MSVREILGLPPVSDDILARFGPPTYTEEQVLNYARLSALSICLQSSETDAEGLYPHNDFRRGLQLIERELTDEVAAAYYARQALAAIAAGEPR